jgi:hypothetical protein
VRGAAWQLGAGWGRRGEGREELSMGKKSEREGEGERAVGWERPSAVGR